LKQPFSRFSCPLLCLPAIPIQQGKRNTVAINFEINRCYQRTICYNHLQGQLILNFHQRSCAGFSCRYSSNSARALGATNHPSVSPTSLSGSSSRTGTLQPVVSILNIYLDGSTYPRPGNIHRTWLDRYDGCSRCSEV
jgi:hypothetical protein